MPDGSHADRNLWRDREFIKLWVGQAVSQIGSRISREGLPFTAAFVLGASPLGMGVLSGVGATAVLLFGLIAGAWVDRIQRRPVMIAADLGRAFVLGSVPVAAMFHRLSMTQLYAVAAITGVLTLLFDVAYQAYLPNLVDRRDLYEGNSKLTIAETIAEVTGPGLTGLLVQLLTAPVAILFDAISFVASAASLLAIGRGEPRPQPRGNSDLTGEIASGLNACWDDPILRAIALRTGTAAFFLGFPSALYILFVVRELRINAALLGFIISIGGVTGMIGAIVAERLVRRFGFAATFIGSSILTGVAGLLVPLAHGPVPVACAYLIAAQLGDVAWPVYNINEVSLRQTVTPPDLLGRVNSAMHLLYRGFLPAGAFAGGALAQVIGIRWAILVGILSFLLTTFWLVLSPIRKIQRLEELCQKTGVADVTPI